MADTLNGVMLGTGGITPKSSDSVYGKTQAEVRIRLSEAAAETTEDSGLEEDDMTVAQWLTTWQRDFLGNVKPGTAISYEMQVRVHIVPTLGAIQLSALRTPSIQRLYNQKLVQGLSPMSMKNIHGCLHRALDIAVRVGYLTKNPANACILPHVQQAEIHPLDTPDISDSFRLTGTDSPAKNPSIVCEGGSVPRDRISMRSEYTVIMGSLPDTQAL